MQIDNLNANKECIYDKRINNANCELLTTKQLNVRNWLIWVFAERRSLWNSVVNIKGEDRSSKSRPD